MKDLYIKPTRNTPEVLFLQSGVLNLSGRAFPENPMFFFQPLLDWIKDYRGVDVTVNVKLEYLNTSASKVLFRMIKHICNTYKSGATIHWYVEEGDDDILEVGEMYEDILSFPFEFHEYEEVKSIEQEVA